MNTPERLFQGFVVGISKLYGFIWLKSLSITSPRGTPQYWYQVLLKGRTSFALMMLIGIITAIIFDLPKPGLLNTSTAGNTAFLVLSEIYAIISLVAFSFFIMSNILYYRSRKDDSQVLINWYHIVLLFLVPPITAVLLFLPFW